MYPIIPGILQLLRYFNPIGAHSSGLIGDNPNSISPNNLAPLYYLRSHIGKLKRVKNFW